MRIDGSEAVYLDPKKSPLEEHIYVLSPLKAATRDSEEYRARLRAGLRHPKTIEHPGGDYVYVPPSRLSTDHEDSHVYRLDRTKGRFYVTVNWGREIQFEYFHNEEGWWAEDPTPKFLGALPAVK